MFVDGLQTHKTRQGFMSCVETAKVHLKAVLQIGCKYLNKFLDFRDSDPRFSYKLYSNLC